ncbi:M20/M25/M40 family metallo-hydrolase [Agilicoccus flavus]|uniref:M20/M25/M40 family metallo-hydrolase n=1 Tax=Agilicoccus flavus TaxID=2775968 RepID=UPI001CF70352|nr:M20/M25/M40 family metallo-hydrolase [Agilicoccus flavus]
MADPQTPDPTPAPTAGDRPRTTAGGAPDPQDEVARICSELIRIDTSNYGDGSGPGERPAAEYVMEQLTEVGLDPEYAESGPGRANVVLRTSGADPDRPALCLHGHLDVVPANAADWRADPFGGELREDGCVWGRGAVDMKDMDAMMLSVLRDLARTGTRPPRDIVWAFFADEEAGGVDGAGWLVDHRPDLFEGVTQAVSEVGGFSVTVPGPDGADRRAYLLQTAEKGIAWLTLTATGTAGHGSVPTQDNAVVHLARAVAAIADHRWPRRYIASVRGLLDGLRDLTGVGYSADDCTDLLALIPGARGFVEGTLADTANPTSLSGGYKHNVVPQTATATVDCRFLPGHFDELMATVAGLVGEHVRVDVHHHGIDLQAPFSGDLVDAMHAAIRAEDPEASLLPYCLSGGTDNKHLARLGVTGYGFAPLRLPPDLPFAPMFHGVDERVPVESLRFGTRVLSRLVRDC